MDNFRDDLLNIVKQSAEIIGKTEQHAWKQVEQFNSKLLDTFEHISTKIIKQSKDRSRQIGNLVLKQIEDEIVAFVIGVVHETIEMTLTPEQHQEIIMQAVQKMKKQLQLGQMQEVVGENKASIPAKETTPVRQQTIVKKDTSKPVEQTKSKQVIKQVLPKQPILEQSKVETSQPLSPPDIPAKTKEADAVEDAVIASIQTDQEQQDPSQKQT